jgi:hypothetical protein
MILASELEFSVSYQRTTKESGTSQLPGWAKGMETGSGAISRSGRGRRRRDRPIQSRNSA